MKKYYYIEIMKPEGEEEELKARLATTYGDMRFDASACEKDYPELHVRMVISSEKERVFNNLKLQTA